MTDQTWYSLYRQASEADQGNWLAFGDGRPMRTWYLARRWNKRAETRRTILRLAAQVTIEREDKGQTPTDRGVAYEVERRLTAADYAVPYWLILKLVLLVIQIWRERR